MKVQVHPCAALLPTISGDEYKKLVADIRAHGLLQPIVTHEGMILDGRNRVQACEDAGIAPRFVEFSSLDLECSPSDYIWSSNVSRRHLTSDQRAALAARWADGLREAKKTESLRNLKKGKVKPEWANPPTRADAGDLRTRKIIAERAQVSEHKARQAETVHKNPETEAKVINGAITLREAVREAEKQVKAEAPASKPHEAKADPRGAWLKDVVFAFHEQRFRGFGTVAEAKPQEIFEGMDRKFRDSVYERAEAVADWLNKFIEPVKKARLEALAPGHAAWQAEREVNKNLDDAFKAALSGKISYPSLYAMFKRKKDILSSVVSPENADVFGSIVDWSDDAKRFYSLLPLDGVGKSRDYLKKFMDESGHNYETALKELEKKQLISSTQGRYPGFRRNLKGASGPKALPEKS